MSKSSPAVWLGAGLSLVAVAVLLWRVNFHDLAASVASANGIWLVPTLALFFVMFALRAWRWSVLLGGTPFWATWHANIIGYFFNITLPLRLGEIARAYVIAKKASLPVARALSAVVAERIIDLASVLLMFAWFAQRIPMGRTFTRAATVGSAFLVLCVAMGLLLVIKGETFERLLGSRLQRFGKARAEGLLLQLRQIREGLRSVGSGTRLLQSLALTVLIWGMTIALTEVCMKAFFADVEVTRAGLVVVFANLGGALPSAPGGLGIVQGFAASALVVPFGVSESTALAFVLVWSLGQQLVLIALGLFSIGRVGLSFNEIRTSAQGAASSSTRDAVT